MLALRGRLGTRELPHRVEDNPVQSQRTGDNVCDEVSVEERCRRYVAAVAWKREMHDDDQRGGDAADGDREENMLGTDQQNAKRGGREIG